MPSPTRIHRFGEGDVSNEQLLGKKGCELGKMAKMGVPIPGGFTIVTEASLEYVRLGKQNPELVSEVSANVRALEHSTGKKLGAVGKKGLLLLSVSSGPPASMPGMTMGTLSNVGLNDATVQSLASLVRSERVALDEYRRLIWGFGDLVMGVSLDDFEYARRAFLETKQSKDETELTVPELHELITTYKRVVRSRTGKEFPQDVQVQLIQAIEAVFLFWSSGRAMHYKAMNGISHTLGTAVNVQSLVFGRMGDASGAGSTHSRRPATGEPSLEGEYLVNAGPEEIFNGTRQMESIQDMKRRWPRVYEQLLDAARRLERCFQDMQVIDFVVEEGALFVLATRRGKRTSAAAFKIAVDMANDGLITRDRAILSVQPTQISELMHKQLDPQSKKLAKLLGRGLPTSPGAAVGPIVFSPSDAAVLKKETGCPVVLVRAETSPEDIRGMKHCAGILTQHGGQTSHAAVLARGMGRCAVSGCEGLSFDTHQATQVTLGGVTLRRGDWISLDGTTGEIFHGKVASSDAEFPASYELLMSWADARRSLDIRANADTPGDAEKSLQYGAQGIGLVRTEHMFFGAERLALMRLMILSDTSQDRQSALEALLPFQQSDFEGILGAMSGKPVIIRLLDPPLHEFCPKEDEEILEVAKLVPGQTVRSVREKIDRLRESNPMLGFRGCRLGLVYPEISEMQIRAIFGASLTLKQQGKDPRPEIEVPLVGALREFLPFRAMAERLAKEMRIQEAGIRWTIGSMIETPRAVIVSDELATHCDFFSFGTNDLTQMSGGFSRDDATKFLTPYVERGVYAVNPFTSIDQEGVGKLMIICVALARRVKPGMDIGICGEHGGDPVSVEFCHRIGLSNVSCSPFRVPLARLAAAQAAVKFGPAPTSLNLFDVLGKSVL